MNTPITSELLEEEPDLAELVQEFVLSLPETMDKINHAALNQDWTAMSAMVHNIKGAGGNYGYPLLGNAAKLIESNLKQNQYEKVVHLLKELENIIERVKDGL